MFSAFREVLGVVCLFIKQQKERFGSDLLAEEGIELYLEDRGA